MGEVRLTQGRWALLAGFLMGVWGALRLTVQLLEYFTMYSDSTALSLLLELLIITALFISAAGILMRLRVGWYAGLLATALVFFSNLRFGGFVPSRDVPVALVFLLVFYAWYRMDPLFE